jgi:hypothetical protein
MKTLGNTYAADVPLYITNPIFQLVSVLLIIANCTNNKNNTASIGRIMLYMWGLGSKSNLQKLIELKKTRSINDIPMTFDTQVVTVVRQCVNDRLITIADDGLYNLSSSGKSLLFKLRNTNLYEEISFGLNSVGKLPETYMKQLEINWYAEI